MKVKGVSMRFGAIVLCALLLFASMPTRSSEAVKAISSDGEATVYLKGDFNGDFDIAYKATLREAPRNRSWSLVGVMLIGTVNPGPGVEVGLSNGDPNGRTISAFTSATGADLQSSYKVVKALCASGCVIELRGTAIAIEAAIDGRVVARWMRANYPLVKPYIQLNAEVAKPGDTISAVLERVRTTVKSRVLPPPTCAFTTRGVEPSGTGTLTFAGSNRSGAPVAFITLATGHRGDRCR